jgi:large subunit ribosomal protein L18
MKQNRRHGLQKRRHKEGRTDYRKRLRLLSSGLPRLVIRKSLKNIVAQLIEYTPGGDKVVAVASSQELQKQFGWNKARRNIPAAYLTGFLLSKKAQKKNIKKAISDIGLQSITKGSVLFSCVKGAVDGGLDVPHSDELMPPAERIQGKHIKSGMPFQETKTKIESTYKK